MIKVKKIAVVFTAGALIFLTCAEGDAKSPAVKVGKTKILKISVLDGNKFKINWKRVKHATQYNVYCSAKKNGTYKKVKTVSGCSCKLSAKLNGKQYYKVRAMKKYSGKKEYGAFSAGKCVILSQKKRFGPKEPADAVSKVSQGPVIQPGIMVPSPSTSPDGNVNHVPATGNTFMFFTVTGLTEEKLVLASETNVSGFSYTVQRPADLNVKEGDRIKITKPVIEDLALDGKILHISGYTKMDVIVEGKWINRPLYVIQRSDNMLSMADSPGQEVSLVLDLSLNEILVMKNDQVCTISDIKVGDKLLLFVSSPIVATVPGQIKDCTKINILT